MTKRTPNIGQVRIKQAYGKIFPGGNEHLESISPQCGFGELGTYCEICGMGPCRIDPFGNGPSTGVCGATTDTIVARNILRESLGSASSPVGHSRELLVSLHRISIGEAKGYESKGVDKLKQRCAEMKIDTERKSTLQMAEAYTLEAMANFENLMAGTATYLKHRCPPKEHIPSSGTSSNPSILAAFVVLEQGTRSLGIATQIKALATDIGIKNFGVILNKSRMENQEVFKEVLRGKDFDVIGEIPFGKDFIQADQRGVSLMEKIIDEIFFGPFEQIVSRIYSQSHNITRVS